VKAGQRYRVTKLTTNGSPHGDGVEVTLEQTSRNKAKLTCSCGKTVEVALPGGRIDMTGLAALDDGVARLHRGDA